MKNTMAAGATMADIEKGHISSAGCHMGNVSYRIGQQMSVGEYSDMANMYVKRNYREPFIVPDGV